MFPNIQRPTGISNVPGTDDGMALGSAALKWSDLFLASGSVINFNSGDVTITHSSNNLAFAGATKYQLDSQVSITAVDTTTNFVTYEDVSKALYASLDWQPAADSSTVRFAIGGICQHSTANSITGAGHYGGLLGYAFKNNATGTDVLVVGTEGRAGAKLGAITNAAGLLGTFDTNTEDDGTILIGLSLYLPDQTDAGHITVPFAIYNQWAAGPVRSLGVFQGPDGAVGSPSYQFVNATGTGIYLSAANTLGLTANGALMLAVGATIDITDAKNVTTGTGTGTKWGTATNQKQGWFGKTPVVQQTDGAALTNNVTPGGTNDTIANYTDLVIYANDAAAIRNDIYQLARKVKIIDDGIRAYGLLS